MSDRVWHSGPPPFPGWWNVPSDKYGAEWRWWDGIRWSCAIGSGASREFAGLIATQPAVMPNFLIRWSYYWPKNACVPRIDPRESEASKVAYVERFNFEVRLIKDRPWWKFWGKK